jgi:hypothetical protein
MVPKQKPHFMMTGGTKVDANVCVTSLWKPFDPRNFHRLPAPACWQFAAARL